MNFSRQFHSTKVFLQKRQCIIGAEKPESTPPYSSAFISTTESKQQPKHKTKKKK